MAVNPGGVLAPDEVVGREELIARLWRTLETTSVVLTAERRMGKTSVVRKMAAEEPPAWRAVYRDLEGFSHPLELAQGTLDDLRDDLPGTHRLGETARALCNDLGGTEVAGVFKLPDSARSDWKAILRRVLSAVAAEPEPRVVLFWDEVPLFIDKLRRRQEPAMAMDVLDLLRSLRQELPALRFVFTGSIGFPSIIDELRAEGYVNRPTNDMRIVEVEPLTEPHAVQLARRCLDDERLGGDVVGADVETLAREVATRAECIPYHVQHVVHGLAGLGRPVERADVARVIEEQLQNPQDPWDLGHHRKRLDLWSAPASDVALDVLDDLALEESLTIRELRERAASRRADGDRAVQDVVARLVAEHYLARERDGRLRFRLDLLRRWWAFTRGLAPARLPSDDWILEHLGLPPRAPPVAPARLPSDDWEG